MTILFAIVYAGTAYALSFVFARTFSYEAIFLIGAVVSFLMHGRSRV